LHQCDTRTCWWDIEKNPKAGVRVFSHLNLLVRIWSVWEKRTEAQRKFHWGPLPSNQSGYKAISHVLSLDLVRFQLSGLKSHGVNNAPIDQWMLPEPEFDPRLGYIDLSFYVFLKVIFKNLKFRSIQTAPINPYQFKLISKSILISIYII
jgi:hypothetical protein